MINGGMQQHRDKAADERRPCTGWLLPFIRDDYPKFLTKSKLRVAATHETYRHPVASFSGFPQPIADKLGIENVRAYRCRLPMDGGDRRTDFVRPQGRTLPGGIHPATGRQLAPYGRTQFKMRTTFSRVCAASDLL